MVTATMRHRKFLCTSFSKALLRMMQPVYSRNVQNSVVFHLSTSLKVLPLRKNSCSRKGARAKIEVETWVVKTWPKHVGSGSVNHKQMSFSWCQDIYHAYNRGEIGLRDPMRVSRGLYTALMIFIITMAPETLISSQRGIGLRESHPLVLPFSSLLAKITAILASVTFLTCTGRSVTD